MVFSFSGWSSFFLDGFFFFLPCCVFTALAEMESIGNIPANMTSTRRRVIQLNNFICIVSAVKFTTEKKNRKGINLYSNLIGRSGIIILDNRKTSLYLSHQLLIVIHLLRMRLFSPRSVHVIKMYSSYLANLG